MKVAFQDIHFTNSQGGLSGGEAPANAWAQAANQKSDFKPAAKRIIVLLEIQWSYNRGVVTRHST